MIMAGHQPNYIPWLGYFYKIYKSDVFVIADDLQYVKGSYINRNRIKTPESSSWLTIPVHLKGNSRCNINQIKTNDELNWKKKHLKLIEMNYKKSKHFVDFFSFFKHLLLKEYNTISDLNNNIIKNLCKVLGINTKIILQSELNVDGKGTEMLINVCNSVYADTYLSGYGGKKYQDENLFLKNKIKLVYSDFEVKEYEQLWGGFLGNMSIIDYIFNCGYDIQKVFSNDFIIDK